MGLIHHWQLDGDSTDSVGGKDGTDTNVSYSNGQFNECGTFLGTTSVINLGQGSEFFPWPEFSISIWFKSAGTTPVTGTNPGLIGFTYGITIAIESTYAFFSVDNGTSITSLASPSTYDFYNDDEWHHLAATANSSLRALYIDGELVGTRVDSWAGSTRWLTNAMNIGRQNNNVNYFYTGQLDDVRVYDHVLSHKEVKDLSQYKVLHLDFNTKKEPTENLVPSGMRTCSSAFTQETGYTFAYTYTQTSDPNNGADGSRADVTKLTCTPAGALGYAVFGFQAYKSGGSEVGDIYQVSFDYKMMSFQGDISGSTTEPLLLLAYANGFGLPDTSAAATLTNETRTYIGNGWYHYSIQGTITIAGNTWWRFYQGSRGSNVEFYVDNFQVELKPYGPTDFEDGGRSVVVSDSTPYNYYCNATEAYHTYSPAWQEDSAIGTGSYKFYADRLLTRAGVAPLLQLTLTCWVKLDEIRESGFIQGQYYLSCGSTGYPRAYWYGTSSEGYHTSNVALTTDTWTMVSAVWDGTHCKIYVNDTLTANVATTTPGNGSTYTAIGTEGLDWPPTSSRQIHGSIDDVKIYARGLSQEDITQLYKNRAAVDQEGNFHCQEVVENIDNLLTGINTPNLVYNGDGQQGNNINFPSLTYVSNENCWTYTSASSSWLSSYYIPINGNQLDDFDEYRLEGFFKQPAIDTAYSRYYYFLDCYNQFYERINHQEVAFYTNTLTELTSDLNNGDLYVYLDDVSNWYDLDGTDVYAHQKTFCCWPTANSYAVRGTWSRHFASATQANSTSSSVKLAAVWDQGYVPAGSYAINSYSGSSYEYIAASNLLMTEDWVYRYGNATAGLGNGFRPGTAYVKIGMLLNRNAGTETSYMKNLALYNLSSPRTTRFYSIDSDLEKISLNNTGAQKACEVSEGAGSFPASKHIDYRDWVVNTQGSQSAVLGDTGFTQNGSTGENRIVNYENPWGVLTPCWFCEPLSDNGADGGFSTGTWVVDNTKTQRFSIWVKKYGSTDGSTYLGCYGSASNTLDLAGTPVTNPYFFSGEVPSLETWYLIVGIIHPNGYSGGDTGVGGVYDISGTQVVNLVEFQQGNNTPNPDSQQMRAYLYYATTGIVTQYFCYPRIDYLEDADCPTLQDLLEGKDTLMHRYDSDLSMNSERDIKARGQIIEV